MKKEIEEKIGSLNEPQLEFVLGIINKIKNHEDGSKMDMDMIFEEAAEKYGDVLKKLAE